MAPKRILILGGGFAGLWSAAGAVRKLDKLGLGPDVARVTLVNRDGFHGIRVRNYEPDIASARVPLAGVLDPIGVDLVQGEVTAIDTSGRCVTVASASGPRILTYDRMVFALGSELARPPVPGLAEHAFDVDTYDHAVRLTAHLDSLADAERYPGQFTAVVVGAGLTGIETATELPGRLRRVLDRAGRTDPVRVILADHNPRLGSDMGESARPAIDGALAELGIEAWPGTEITSIGPTGVRLGTGTVVPAGTVIWCAGMRASPLTRLFAVELDSVGRLPVDEFLRLPGRPGVLAAGDAARATVDAGRPSVMSCQHGRPMGRIAGHNVVADLFGVPMIALRIAWYVTVLDLGPAGAVYTEGWDRRVVTTGAAAKATKQTINRRRIYPPPGGDRAAILAAAAPLVQEPPTA
ncbi:NAD(P)/FAD-dependent oxidoreductase [Rhodococcus kronopolitis]|uniref:NAD(P)/FAD-dependent oxidoreductase n=1 Tax=Rhodococcus kronopolitis TaxID=1460226 RepID=A0ABV9FKP6_9NOCA